MGFDCIKSRFGLNVTKTRNSCFRRKIVSGIHLGNRLVGFYLLTVQKKMSFGTLFVNCCCQVKIGLNHYFVLFSIFFCSDDHIFLFTRSHYIPILIVYHLIQFSKEENWFYKRFQLTFQKWRKYYFLLIFQVLLTGTTLGPEINSLCRQQGWFHVLFVSGCLDRSGVRSWKINKIIQVFR